MSKVGIDVCERDNVVFTHNILGKIRVKNLNVTAVLS